MVIDLRSDILGRPTPEMIEAMTEAAKDRFTYGFREDPITSRLEELAASILGKEDALFFPTATMCNHSAVHIFCARGEELIAEANSHIFTMEGGGIAALSGVMAKPIHGELGVMDIEEIKKVISLGTDQRPRTGLIWVENTHNRAGGTVVSLDQMKTIYEIAKAHHIPVHLDGARIFNAAVYLKVPVSRLTQYTDTVTISLNKGLCAPLGAILAGNRDFIKKAVRVRLMYGGGWRPTGILAAPGIIALEKMIDRLDEDHTNTRKLAEGIAKCEGVSIDLRAVQTNIIYAKINHPRIPSGDLIEKLKKNNVIVNPIVPDSIRMVIHREVGIREVNKVIYIFQQIMEENGTVSSQAQHSERADLDI
jgi:threonine aldolase